LLLLFIDNWLTILFILLIVDLTFTLWLVWFLNLFRTPKKATGKKSNELSTISKVTLILVSCIVEVQIHWSASSTPTGMTTMMIGIPLLDTCFSLALDRLCGHVRNRRCRGKGMEHLTQSFSYLTWLGQDSWECHLGFIASKHSLNPQVLITSIKASFMICICCNVKIKFIQSCHNVYNFYNEVNMEIESERRNRVMKSHV
jgi:hypothetical protein